MTVTRGSKEGPKANRLHFLFWAKANQDARCIAEGFLVRGTLNRWNAVPLAERAGYVAEGR
ncbi:MAG: hypothetical protein B7Z73_14900 [Planctomycetia bacterium 21-64-5]|nr:MAG: hypothetical protein B7Z73_14900 [Planctomycetia bacterium 21-64-5]